MRLKNLNELSDAIEYTEKNIKSKIKGSYKLSELILITEEVLSALLKSGKTDIDVNITGIFSPHIEITLNENCDDVFEPDINSAQKIEDEIRNNIFSFYNENIKYTYNSRKNISRFEIYPAAKKSHNINKDVEEYYRTANAEQQKQPLGIVKYLAKKNILLTIIFMLNKIIHHAAAVMLAVYAANIIEAVTTHKDFFIKPVIFNVAASFIALFVGLLCAWIDDVKYHEKVREIESALKLSIVKKLQNLSMKYHVNTASGKILSKLVSDVQFIKLLLQEQLTDILNMLIDVVFVIVMSLVRMPSMLIFYAVVIPVYVWLMNLCMKPIKHSKMFMRQKTEMSNSSFSEMLGMGYLTRSHGLRKTEYKIISAKVSEVQSAAVNYDKYQLILNAVIFGFSHVVKILCLCIAGFMTVKGYIAIGSVVLFLSLMNATINSTTILMNDIPQITTGYDGLASINEILFEKDTEKDGTKILPLPVRGDIEFRNVTFGYENDKPVLNAINFHVPSGCIAAFVGKSGAGKTTILSLILGLQSKQSGNIYIDGIDIDELKKDNYRRYVAVVPQNTILFSGTLWENLTYGLQYVTASRVLEVLNSVGLDDLLNNNPDGLNMQIFEGGSNVSGGQRQRIAIARAMLREPEILLFDEATSALDSKSEKEVQKAIDAITGKCTVIMIAHKLNTIKKADIIYKVENANLTVYNSFEDFITQENL